MTRFFGLLSLTLLSVMTAVPLSAGVAIPDEGERPSPIGRFLTIDRGIDDRVAATVTNLAVQLQNRAEREDRDAVLVLEIRPGTSRTLQVVDLARFLTSNDIDRVRTVAWIPETLNGSHAALAIACNDIIMDGDAALGDIGRGDSLPSEDRAFVLSIADRRPNPRVSRGIVSAMLDRGESLLRVTVEDATGNSSYQFVTRSELNAMVKDGAVVTATEVVKEAGTPGLFRGVDAERTGFLVRALAESRRDVASYYELPMESLRETGIDDRPVIARLIQVHGVVDPLLAEFVIRETGRAVSDGANVIIYEIDSPGGYLSSSEEIALTIADLNVQEVTTVAWIPEDAISGAAVIALGCDQIIMKKGAVIGDAGVIQETAEGGAFERVPEKQISPFKELMNDLANRKNRPPALLQAMVLKDLEVFRCTHPDTGRISYLSEDEIVADEVEWVKGPVVPESRKDLLLTLNGERAAEVGIAEEPAEDLDEVRLRLGISGESDLQQAERTWVDTFVFLLRTSFGGFILITFAILCIYVELHVPSGLFGIIASVFFALFFWSRYLGGTAGTLEIVLFLLGLVLIALELFVIPGFGVFGVSGILMVLGALVMASHTFSGITAGEGFQQSVGTLTSIAGAMVTVIAVAAVMNRFLPSIPFINKLILTPPGYAAGNGPRLNPALTRAAGGEPVIAGDRGTTQSTLRPHGKARFENQFLDVVSDGAYIGHDVEVEVVRVAGNRIIVRAVEERESESAES